MGLKESLAGATVGELALREPALVPPPTPLSTAVEKMNERQLGCLFVVDAERRPIGLFTESDLTRLLHQSPGALTDPIENHATGGFVTVTREDRVSRVLEAMQREDTRFVCVVDQKGVVAGLTGQKGLMEFVAEHFPQQVMVEHVSSRPLEQREGA